MASLRKATSRKTESIAFIGDYSRKPQLPKTVGSETPWVESRS